MLKKKIRYTWIPRTLAILFIILISLFALDTPFGIGFLIHLIPSFIFIGCLIVAWFKPKIGGILFGLVGIGTIIFFDTYRELISFIIISVPPIVIGILFYFIKKK
jgi:hypothetical protein